MVLVSGSRILDNRSSLVAFNRVRYSSLLAIHLDMRSTDRDEMANRSIWPFEQREIQAHASSSHHRQGTRRNRYAYRCCRDCKRTRTKPEACRCRGGGNDRTDSHMVESSLASLWNRRRRSNTARRVTDPRGPRVRTQAGSDTRSDTTIDEPPGSTLAHRQLLSDQPGSLPELVHFAVDSPRRRGALSAGSCRPRRGRGGP